MIERELRYQAYFRIGILTLILIVIGIYASSIDVAIGGTM